MGSFLLISVILSPISCLPFSVQLNCCSAFWCWLNSSFSQLFFRYFPSNSLLVVSWKLLFPWNCELVAINKSNPSKQLTLVRCQIQTQILNVIPFSNFILNQCGRNPAWGIHSTHNFKPESLFSGKYLIQAPEQIWMPTFPTLQPVLHCKVLVFAAVTRPPSAQWTSVVN